MDKFWDTVRYLRKHMGPHILGLEIPIHVRLIPNLQHCLGSTRVVDGKKGPRFLIELDQTSVSHAPGLAVLLLTHEWAHALTWHLEEELDHGQKWSDMYGIIWRFLVGESPLTPEQREAAEENG